MEKIINEEDPNSNLNLSVTIIYCALIAPHPNILIKHKTFFFEGNMLIAIH